jgi:hypothetical protein
MAWMHGGKPYLHFHSLEKIKTMERFDDGHLLVM